MRIFKAANREEDYYLIVRKLPEAQITRLWFILGILGFIYLAAVAIGGNRLIFTANFLGPLLITITFGFASLIGVLKAPLLIWTPYLWFIAAIAIFFGLGPLVYVLGSESTIEWLNGTYFVDQRMLLWTNVLNAVGIFFVTFAFYISYKILNARPKIKPRNINTLSINAVATAILLIGGVIEFGLILPASWGMLPFSMPGYIQSLGALYLFGLMLWGYIVSKGGGKQKTIYYCFVAIQVVVYFFSFQRGPFFLSIVLPAFGMYLGNKRLDRLLVWIGIGVLALFMYFPMARYGRFEIYRSSGNIYQATIQQRLQIAKRYIFEMNDLRQSANNPEFVWGRIAYAPEQAYAMVQYDSGFEGHTLKDALAVFVPRFIWKDKPQITALALNFYQQVTGKQGTYLGLGIFAEGYWDYGWIGVVLLSILAGTVYAILTQASLSLVATERYVYLPAIVLGVKMGEGGLTQFFVPAFLGSFVIYLAFAVIARVIEKIYQGLRV